jgi:hypothetical protein
MTRSEFAAILLLTASVTSFFGPAIFGDRSVFTWNMDRWLPWAASASPDDLARPTRLADCARQFAVMRGEATEAARDGRVPLWNRHLFSGTPFLANFQPGVFYPPNVLLFRSGWSVPDQMTAFAALHLLVGAVGTFFLLRAFGAGVLAALLGAIVFAWGAPNASRTGLPTLLATASWLPWIVLATRRWFLRGDALAWAGVAAGLALAGLAGFAQLFVFAVYVGALAGLVFGLGRRDGHARSRWALVIAAGAIGLGLVAIHLVPTLEFAGLAQDAKNTGAMLASATLHPWILAKFLVPDLFGSPVDDSSVAHLLRVGSGYYFQTEWTTAIYVGVLPWLLAAWVALAPLDRRREALFALLVTVLGLLLCVRGPWTPLLTALPGLSFSRPDRATILIGFGLALLTGLGAHSLAGREGPGLRRPANAFAIAIGALCLAFTIALAVAGRVLVPERVVDALGAATVARAAWIATAVVPRRIRVTASSSTGSRMR